MTLRWKPKKDWVRMIFTDGEYLNLVDSVHEHPGKIFAAIGPFDGHTDKADLQDMLETLLRGYNLHSHPSNGRRPPMAICEGRPRKAGATNAVRAMPRQGTRS